MLNDNMMNFMAVLWKCGSSSRIAKLQICDQNKSLIGDIKGMLDNWNDILIND